MPYENEFASYRPLRRIAESESVQALLKKSRIYIPSAATAKLAPLTPPSAAQESPSYVAAMDGSWAEVDVKNGFPGAKVGYVTVASVLVDLTRVGELDEHRPVDPVEFRKTEEASTLDAAIPGSNVVTRTHTSAKHSFREAVYENFHDLILDSGDGVSLLDTYEELLKPRTATPTACPYDDDSGCNQKFVISGKGVGTCNCSHKYPTYSTDILRIHERFHDQGSNGEPFGEVMSVWERVLLVHLLRWFERRGLLKRLSRVAFVLDGPLALFGHPAWLSMCIKTELMRINSEVRKLAGEDLLIIGIEKTGTFVNHFEELDKREDGSALFLPRNYALLTDSYIKQRIIFSSSDKRYGNDTYFGRKFFYKTASGARIVATIPFLSKEQDTLESDDVTLYPSFGTVCELLDKLASSQLPNSLAPVLSAHSHAAIPLTLGGKVLQQLANALMKKD